MPAASLVTTGNISQAPNNLGAGVQVGASSGASGSLVGFYGATPIVQPAGVGNCTDASGGTAAATNGILTLTATYNSTILANSIATLAAQVNGLETALINLGLVSK